MQIYPASNQLGTARDCIAALDRVSKHWFSTEVGLTGKGQIKGPDSLADSGRFSPTKLLLGDRQDESAGPIKSV